jgi:hypothetical protein
MTDRKKPEPSPIFATPVTPSTPAPTPDDGCFVCGAKRPVMLVVSVRDGERSVCSPCWRRDYRC